MVCFKRIVLGLLLLVAIGPIAYSQDSLQTNDSLVKVEKEKIKETTKQRVSIFKSRAKEKKQSLSNQVDPAKGDTSSSRTKEIKTGLKNKGNNIFQKNKTAAGNLKSKTFGSKPKSTGNISIGYDYGIIPFAANIKYPSGFYHAEGSADVDLFTLPFNLSGYYSSIANISGLNNYFRLSFDEKRYKDKLMAEAAVKEANARGKIDSIYKVRQVAEQRLLYVDYLGKQPIPSYQSYLANLQMPSMPIGIPLDVDTMNVSNDSINQLKQKQDSLSRERKKLESQYKDSLDYYRAQKQKLDSIQNKVKEYESSIAKYEKEISTLKATIEALKNPGQAAGKYNPYGSKTKEYLSYIKKFDIGLCYPNYSTFLVNGAAIKGVNLEWEKDNYYVAFTHGKTMNTLLFTNNEVQNKLQNIRNLYNFFDFNNVEDQRRITALKVGWGKKEGTHLHVGFLYGLGKTSYINLEDSIFQTAGNDQGIEKNYVIELDGRWAINANNLVDLVYAKSSLQQAGVDPISDGKGFAALLKTQRSNAALLRYTGLIPKTRTKLIVTTRWVDPFFKSYGIGFMRSDNIRYELKAEQSITNRIKFTGTYRKEEDNLLSILYFKTTLQTIGANVSWKLTKRLTVRAGYNPVLQKINSSDKAISITNKNNISNIILTYSPKIKNFNSNFNALYSYYNLSSGDTNMIFKNINLYNVTQLKSGFRNNIGASWFYADSKDSTNGNTFLVTEEISYTFKNTAFISLGAKYADNTAFDKQLGYTVKIGVPAVKHLNVEASFEKLVLGDFYNNYNIEQIKKFPYYLAARLILYW